MPPGAFPWYRPDSDGYLTGMSRNFSSENARQGGSSGSPQTGLAEHPSGIGDADPVLQVVPPRPPSSLDFTPEAVEKLHYDHRRTPPKAG